MTGIKRKSLSNALQRSDEIVSFLEGDLESSDSISQRSAIIERIAVTVRLTKEVANALIEASAKRRINRENAWSQQDIVAEALGEWLRNRSETVDIN